MSDFRDYDNCVICGISEDIPSPYHDHRANFRVAGSRCEGEIEPTITVTRRQLADAMAMASARSLKYIDWADGIFAVVGQKDSADVR